MLYLVKSELKGGYPLPPEQWLEIVTNGLETIMNYKKQGKVIVHGAFVGRQAGCIIWDVDSNEELQRSLTQLPFFPFMEWEITPLISTEHTLESLKQSVAAVRASKK
jgi:muconolactone delta-isomerase